MVFFNHHKERHHPPKSAIHGMSLPYFLMDDHTIMLNFIENILHHFESCFHEKLHSIGSLSFTIGFMLRSDKLRGTSVIRDLALIPGYYDPLLHFFRASSWSLANIRERWFSAVRKYTPLYTEGGFHILVGNNNSQA